MTQMNDAPRRSIFRAVCDRNPFYLLSAACMLFGCIALTNSSSFSPIKLNRLLMLIATLNFYEVLLIALALFLIVRRGLRRDGTILLFLEAFFLVDVTFLNSEIVQTNLKIGLAINGLLLALAIVKVAVIFRCLGISLAGGVFATAVAELVMLFALPGAFKHIAAGHNASLPALAIYGAWWAIGCLPVIATLLMRNRHYFPEPQSAAYARSRAIVGMFVILPVISLLAHATTSNWVYNVRWYPANLSPLALGLAIAIGGFDAHLGTLGWRMKAHFVLPLIAAAMSLQTPSNLVFNIGPVGFAPLRCALIGAMGVYVYGFIVHRHILFALAACVCLGMAGMGMSIRQILDNLNLGAQQSYSIFKRLLPKDRSDWGVLSMIASFLLLVAGAVVSLRKPSQPVVQEILDPKG